MATLPSPSSSDFIIRPADTNGTYRAIIILAAIDILITQNLAIGTIFSMARVKLAVRIFFFRQVFLNKYS